MSKLLKVPPEIQSMNDMYKTWAFLLLNKIEEIAKEKYPDVAYWCDTGSRVNVALAMLEQFRKDLK